MEEIKFDQIRGTQYCFQDIVDVDCEVMPEEQRKELEKKIKQRLYEFASQIEKEFKLQLVSVNFRSTIEE